MDKEKTEIGSKPSSEELFLLEWGKESLKNNIKLVNDLLSRFTTINIAFAGGAVIQNLIQDPIYKISAIIIFLLGFGVALIGIYPYESEIDLSDPQEIKSYMFNALKYKKRFLFSSVILTVIGLTWAIMLILFSK